jgi:glycine/D-amino acid oxidase-like deaminating enzyme
MRRYTAFAIAREAARHHMGWERAWRSPTPRTRYDVVIVGAGGHGLATAYYLGRNHGITNVAVIEKGWLGGGNTGRNTTIIRSNYLQDPSAAIYEKARSLYETLSQDLNYNVMFSPRGVMMLAQTEHEIRGYQRTAHANALQGVSTEFIGPGSVKELCPIINIEGPRYPVLGALWQPRGGTARHDAVAWGYARAVLGHGDGHHPADRGDGRPARGRQGRRRRHHEGHIGCGKLGIVVAGHSGVMAERAGFRLPIESVALAGAGLGTHQALHGRGRDGQHRARLHEPVRQGRDGHRRRRGRLQQLHPAGQFPPRGGDGARAGGDLPDHLAAEDAALVGRDRGHDGRPLADHLEDAGGRHFRQLRLGNRRLQGDPGLGLGHGGAYGEGAFAAGRRVRHGPIPRRPFHRRASRRGWRIDGGATQIGRREPAGFRHRAWRQPWSALRPSRMGRPPLPLRQPTARLPLRSRADSKTNHHSPNAGGCHPAPARFLCARPACAHPIFADTTPC